MLAPSHIALLGLLVVLALVVFGPKRLPELGHSVGRAIQEFKHASAQAAHHMTEVTDLAGASTTTTTATTQPVTAAVPMANGAGPVPASTSAGDAAGR